MTLTLTIENETSLPNGAPVSVKVTDKRNLDIGRGAHLDWTLPDPSRFISGKHCEVRYRDGAYWLYDVSTNGTFLNDNTRRIQTPHKLDDGDRLAIGSYIILVTIESEDQKAAEAFAAPGEADAAPASSAGDSHPEPEAAEPVLAERAIPPTEEPAPAATAFGSSVEAAAAPPERGADFWSDLIAADLGLKDEPAKEEPIPSRSSPSLPRIGAMQLGGHPSESNAAENKPSDKARSDSAAEETAASQRSALPPVSAFDAWSEKDSSAATPARAEEPADLKALFETASVVDEAVKEDISLPPLPKADAFPPSQSDPDHGRVQPEPAAAPSFGQDSAHLLKTPDTDSAKPHEVASEEASIQAAAPLPIADEAIAEAPLERTELPRVAEPVFAASPRTKTQPPTSPPWMAQPAAPAAEAPAAQPRAQAAPSAAPADGEVTLDAFIERFAAAAGISPQLFDKRDKLKAADDLGFMMHLVVSSLRQLLSARDSAKRFARTSSRTVVQAFDNNPLKFAPTPEDALKIMFGPKTSGYLDARRTLETAFEDLKTHQIKTFSAMQGAVKMLVEDLDPEELDASLGEEHGLAALLSSRKSKLWDLYLARWQAKTLRHEDGLADAFMFYFAECYDRAED